MIRSILVVVVALLASGCAAVPETRHVVASTGLTPMPSVHAQLSKPVSSELDCMADCLADETCEACAEMCLR